MGIRQFARYSFGVVADGTRCDNYDENSGICVNGKCQVKSCKVYFNANSPTLISPRHAFFNIPPKDFRVRELFINISFDEVTLKIIALPNSSSSPKDG